MKDWCYLICFTVIGLNSLVDSHKASVANKRIKELELRHALLQYDVDQWLAKQTREDKEPGYEDPLVKAVRKHNEAMDLWEQNKKEEVQWKVW